MAHLSITLPDALHEFVEERVQSGRFSSTAELIQTALRMLQIYELADDTSAELEAELLGGLDSLEGEGALPLDAAAIASIKAEGRRRLTSPDR